VHVKGHSADGGNDRADELVQWGKTGGPYCRVREGGGKGEGRYDGGAGDGDGGRLGDGADLRIGPSETELWGG
jgi:hypothetical protein